MRLTSRVAVGLLAIAVALGASSCASTEASENGAAMIETEIAAQNPAFTAVQASESGDRLVGFQMSVFIDAGAVDASQLESVLRIMVSHTSGDPLLMVHASDGDVSNTVDLQPAYSSLGFEPYEMPGRDPQDFAYGRQLTIDTLGIDS